MERAARIGVTGKLGSGKSTLMRELANYGILAVNTDELAREIMVSDPAVRNEVQRLAGSEIYTDGELDRKLLAAKLFSDDDLRGQLEAIIHPVVTEKVEQLFETAPAHSLVAVESALILFSDIKEHFDYIVLVDAPDEAVLDRVKQFGKLTEEDAEQRLNVQDYRHANLDEVDITIENTGTPEEFQERAITLAQMLKTLAERDLPEKPLHAN